MNSASENDSTQHVRFPALQYRDFRILWYGMLFASGTLAFQYYAQMWLIYSITDSAWVLGLLGAVRGGATILFGLYGGALADRMDRRILLIVTQTTACVVTLVLGTMVVLGIDSLVLIFGLIFLGAATASIDAPIRQALIPELIPQQHIPNAVALTTAAQMGSFAITPILAGFVIDWIGPGGAYLLSAIGNTGILVALFMMRYTGEARQTSRETVAVTIRTGLTYTRQQPLILWIILVSFVTSAFCFAIFHGVIVKWAGAVLLMEPGQYGMLAATWGVGTLIASWVLSFLGNIRHQGKIFLIGSLLFGLSFLAFGLVRSIPVVAVIYLVNGAAWTSASITATSIVQRMVSNEYRGRVMSLLMLNGAFAQMNALLLGLVADTFSIELLIPFTSAICCMLLIILIISVPSLRSLDDEVDKVMTTTSS